MKASISIIEIHHSNEGGGSSFWLKYTNTHLEHRLTRNHHQTTDCCLLNIKSNRIGKMNVLWQIDHHDVKNRKTETKASEGSLCLLDPMQDQIKKKRKKLERCPEI